MVRLLLQAGANLTLTNKKGEMPIASLRKRHPTYHAAIAHLEKALTDTTVLLVKARRLITTAHTDTPTPS